MSGGLRFEQATNGGLVAGCSRRGPIRGRGNRFWHMKYIEISQVSKYGAVETINIYIYIHVQMQIEE